MLPSRRRWRRRVTGWRCRSGFVIDLIRADGELVEIQTGGFGPLGAKLDALLDRHRFRIVHPVAAERRIVRVDMHGEVLSIRRSPKCGTVLEVFDKLTAFPSLLTHPNLTVEVLLVGEDHIRAAAPVTARRRTRDQERDTFAKCSPGSSCTAPTTSCARFRSFRCSYSAPASWLPSWDAVCSSRSGPPTACGRSTSSNRPASAAARRCTGGFLTRHDRPGPAPGDRSPLRVTRCRCPQVNRWSMETSIRRPAVVAEGAVWAGSSARCTTSQHACAAALRKREALP